MCAWREAGGSAQPKTRTQHKDMEKKYQIAANVHDKSIDSPSSVHALNLLLDPQMIAKNDLPVLSLAGCYDKRRYVQSASKWNITANLECLR